MEHALGVSVEGELGCPGSLETGQGEAGRLEPPAPPNRVATEAMVLARNEGRDYLAEGPEILERAARATARRRPALEVW